MSRKDEWRNLTSELGFEFKEGVNAFLDSPTLRRFAAEEMNQNEGLNHLITVKTTDKSQAKAILAERSIQEQLQAVSKNEIWPKVKEKIKSQPEEYMEYFEDWLFASNAEIGS